MLPGTSTLPSECSNVSLELKDIHLDPKDHSKVSHFYVNLSVGAEKKKTTKERYTQWSNPLEITNVSPATPLHIEVIKERFPKNKSLGYYHGTVKDLLKKSGSDSSISVSLDRGGRKLLMSVSHDWNKIKDTDPVKDTRKDAEDAIDAADNLPSDSTPAEVNSIVGSTGSVQEIARKAFDAAESLPQSSAVGEALKNIGAFVDIVDCFAEIHPYINAAWKVLSAVYKVWQAHEQQIQSIRDLAKSLRDMLDFVRLGSHIQELEKGKKVIEDMWKAIGDAAKFIKTFCENSSLTDIRDAITKKVENDIEDTQKRFSQLRADLDSLVGLQALQKIKEVGDEFKAFHTEALSKEERELIDRLPSVHTLKAAYDRVDAALEGTRTKLFQTLYEELADISPGAPRVIWLHGLAGTGKSTISATIARGLEERKILAGNFFFSRSEKERSNPELLFPVLARQFASFDPLRSAIIKALRENDPDIAKAEITTQFSKLIAGPLRTLQTHTSPIILVIDALDECISPERFLRIIHANNSQLPPCLKLFLTSRPEDIITATIRKMGGNVREHALIRSDIDAKDVSLAFEKRLSDIREMYPLGNEWPGKEQLQELVEKANGLFIWMSTVCKFIGDPVVADPVTRLEITLGINTEESDNPFAALDELYLQVLLEAFPKQYMTRQRLFRDILGAIVIAKTTLSEMELTQLLDVQTDKFQLTIKGLRAVLHIPENQAEPIQILHPSFIDFATNKERCTDSRLFIESGPHHRQLTLRCLEIMNKGLKENICGIDFTLFNSEINNLATLISQYIPGSLRYACQFWADHLDHVIPDEEIVSSLRTFYENHFLHWLELISLLGRFDGAHSSLVIGQKWLRNHPNGIPDERFNILVDDCRRFVMEFRVPISQSALHVYHSALPFTGKKTQLYQTYSNSCGSNILVRSTSTEKWSSCLSVLEGHTGPVYSAAFSPDGKRIVSCSRDKTLRLWDGLMGAPVGDAMQGHTHSVWSAVFSPDGKRIVSCSSDKTLRLWDSLTGAPVGDAMQGHTHSVWSAVFSPDGKQIVSCSRDKTLRLWDGLTGAPVGDAMQGHTDSVWSAVFSPDGKRIVSCSSDKTLRLWDSLTGAPVGDAMQGHTHSVWSAVFSPDGKRIVSCSRDKSLRLWDGLTGAPVGDAMQGHTHSVWSAAFSPDGKQILSCSNEEILCWDVHQRTQTVFSPDMWSLKATDPLIRLNSTGWIHGVGGKKLWWMPALNRGSKCFTPDGRIFTGSNNGLVTFVDGRKAFKFSLAEFSTLKVSNAN